MQIDSSTKKDEEVEELFMSLDTPENEIEVVIHVNMLKEGWDVSNLYTIVPLRAADAPILVEQSIGRGLRLPYGGRRTGEPEVDKLTVIAHENFKKVIEAAKDPNSVLNKVSFVEYDPATTKEKVKVVTAVTQQEQKIQQQQTQAQAQNWSIEKQKESHANIDAQKAVWAVLPKLNTKVESQQQLTQTENIEKVKEAAITFIKQKVKEANTLFAKQEAKEQIAQVEKVVQMVVRDYVQNVIPIPRMTIQQGETHIVYNDFDLDIRSGFSLPYLNEEIVRIGLVDNSYEIIQAQSSGAFGNPEEQLVSELINYDDIDYDLCAELLFKLSGQAVSAVKSQLSADADITRVIYQFKKKLGQRIHDQIVNNITLESDGFVVPNILPFVEILPQYMTETEGYGRKDYRDVITPKSAVSKYIFTGFMKSYYVENKFDSTTEQDFAFVLENDKDVLKWLRPVTNQFNIYWGNGAHKYEPDFIVETADTIYMVETKKAKDVNDADVQSKKAAAEEYCKYASEYNSRHGGKQWKYVLLPHDSVERNKSFVYVIHLG